MSGLTVAAPPGERLRLDHNERLFPAPELVRLLSRVPESALARYPEAAGLEESFGAAWDLDAGRVLATAGADDAIDRVCRRYLTGGRELITVNPTFEMIPAFASLAGGRVRAIRTLDDPAPLARTLDLLSERTGLVAVVSPHNPSGQVAPARRLLEISDRLPDDAVLLADLAYVEFADRDPTPELLRRDNVLVVRTLSKAWGLAGLRVGFVLGPRAAVADLRAGGAPFPLSAPSIWLAEQALALGDPVTSTYVAAVRRERERLVSALRASGAEPFESQANFVLASTDRAAALYRGVRQRGIAIRRYPNLPDLVRITLPGDEATFCHLLRVLDTTFGHIS